MRRILQASLLSTCLSSALALGCRNSQHCCTPCCHPSGGQPVPAAPTPAPIPGQGPAVPTMPLAQDGSPAAAPVLPPTPLPGGVASLDSPGPSRPAASPVLPLPTGEPSPAASAPTRQEVLAAPQTGLAPLQLPAAAEQSAQAAPAGSLPAAGPAASGSLSHDPTYHSLVGVLDYVAIQKGWVLRYAAPEDEDRYGGCVTLVGAGSMKGFRSGQRVQVSGELVDPASLKPHPAYRVLSLQPLGPQG